MTTLQPSPYLVWISIGLVWLWNYKNRRLFHYNLLIEPYVDFPYYISLSAGKPTIENIDKENMQSHIIHTGCTLGCIGYIRASWKSGMGYMIYM